MPKQPSGLRDCTKFWISNTGLKNPIGPIGDPHLIAKEKGIRKHKNIRKQFNYHRNGLGHQNDCCLIV